MPASGASSTEASEFRFAGFTLDLRQGRLWGASGEIQLRPKPFALLGYMVRHAGRVVSKEELLDAVWPDVIVTEDSLSQCVHALRDGLGQAGPLLAAWQAYHRGLEAFGRSTEPSLLRARAYLTRATELDPGFVGAFAALSECQATLSRSPFCTDAKGEAAAARRTAEDAMRLDEAAPSAQFAYAHAPWLHGAPEVALGHAQRSVALGPSFATGFAEIGFYEALYGDPEQAFANLARAEVLNPMSPFLDSLHIDRAIAHLQRNDLEEAAIWATKAVSKRESYAQMQISGAMVLAAAGHLGTARTLVGKLDQEGAVYDPYKVFMPPFSLRGPAKDRLLRAVADLGF